MNWRHTILIARLELIKRIRSTRWMVALGLWALVLLMICAVSVFTKDWFVFVDESTDAIELSNATVASMVLYFVLIIGMTVAGGNAAGSINGDRTNATLALLQVTPASGASIVLGKLIAAWLTSLALLAVATPFLIFFMFRAPSATPSLLLGMLVAAFSFLSIAGIGIGTSTLTVRAAGSTAATFLAIIALLLGGPVLTAILDRYTSERFEVPYKVEYEIYDDELPEASADPADGEAVSAATEVPHESASTTPSSHMVCEDSVMPIYVRHTQSYWWLMLSNPVIVMADALPYSVGDAADPYADPGLYVFPNAPLVNAAAYLSKPGYADKVINDCGPNAGQVLYPGVIDTDPHDQLVKQKVGTMWAPGLMFLLVLGAVFTGIAIRRTHVPVDRLPRGVRIA